MIEVHNEKMSQLKLHVLSFLHRLLSVKCPPGAKRVVCGLLLVTFLMARGTTRHGNASLEFQKLTVRAQTHLTPREFQMFNQHGHVTTGLTQAYSEFLAKNYCYLDFFHSHSQTENRHPLPCLMMNNDVAGIQKAT